MTAPARLAEAEMLDRAARAVCKVDLYGRRGATMVSRVSAFLWNRL